MSVTNGAHSGSVSGGHRTPCQISYLHFHDTGAARTVERAGSICRAYGYTDTATDVLEQYKLLTSVGVVPGFHRVDEYRSYLVRALAVLRLSAPEADLSSDVIMSSRQQVVSLLENDQYVQHRAQHNFSVKFWNRSRWVFPEKDVYRAETVEVLGLQEYLNTV